MRVQTGRLLPMMAYFACGSVVLFFLFTKFWLFEPKFREQELVSSVLPEAISPVKCGIV